VILSTAPFGFTGKEVAMARRTRTLVPRLSSIAALAILTSCDPSCNSSGEQDRLFSAPMGLPPFEPTCAVESCSLPSAPCTVGMPSAPFVFTVPNRATVVFRSEIPVSAGLQAPYQFVWRFSGGGPTARPPATNDRESRVQHIYDVAGRHVVSLTVTDARGASHVGASACEVIVRPPS
jgi:PKD domain-containing protein